jgi:hypothetical protein
LTNIIATKEKDSKNINNNANELTRLIKNIFSTDLGGIFVEVNKYGMSLVTENNGNKITIISFNRDHRGKRLPVIQIGGTLKMGDGNSPIIINEYQDTIQWPNNNNINLLGLNNQGYLTTTSLSINTNRIGSQGYNEIIAEPELPITISSKFPSTGDIIIEVGKNTQGNIKLYGTKIEQPELGKCLYLCINDKNELITMMPSTPSPIYCTNLFADGNLITLGGNNLSNPSTIILNGSIYYQNAGFPLPANNKTTTLIIDSNGQVSTLVSSAKYKTNIKKINISEKAFNNITPSSYNYIKEHNIKTNEKNIGLIAEEIYKEEELRDLVILDKLGEPLSIDYTGLIAVVIYQMQQDKLKIANMNNSLNNEIKNLYNIIQELKNEIETLKKA